MGRTRLESRRPTYTGHDEMETEQKSTEREDRVKDDLRLLGVMKGEELEEHREAWREIIVEAAKGLTPKWPRISFKKMCYIQV